MAINTTLNDAPSKALQMLKRIRRLEGTALISGGVLLHDDCPRGADSRLLSQSVVRLFDGLEEKNEYADDVLLRFDAGDVMLMFRYPIILCLFFGKDSDLASIEKGGIQFLSQFGSALGILDDRPRSNIAAPATDSIEVEAKIEEVVDDNGMDDEESWAEYRRQVEILFTKVLGSAQAAKFLNRELKAMGVSQNGYLRKSQFRPFGQKMTQRIKDKGIRRQIEDELFSVIDEVS